MSVSVRLRNSPVNSPKSSPCTSPRFLHKHPGSPAARRSIMPVVVIHGGAATISPDEVQLRLEGVKRAANCGYEVLQSSNGTALDAVEAAVRVMEDDPVFNAGLGASLTRTGKIELDALIMEGTRMKAGSVAGISKVANPVTLSRHIMEKSDHVLMIGDGAHKFADEVGMPTTKPKALITKLSCERLNYFKTFMTAINDGVKNSSDHDTVGAVAVDSAGHVACATSTGGITAKQEGRVGDSPCVGSGGFADDFIGAVSTTGHGEAIMRVCLARHITGLMQQGMTAQEAAVAGLEYMKNRVQGYGGVVVVSSKGDIGVHFTTKNMSWAYRKGSVVHYGIKSDDDLTEDGSSNSSPL